MIRSLMLLAALLLPPSLLAQGAMTDGEAEAGLAAPVGSASAEESALPDGRKEKPEGEGFSPAAETPAQPALALEAPFTAYDPAGTCLVVDELLRDYCLQHPDDLSCQVR